MATSGTGRWSTMAHAAPSSSAGVPIDGDSNWRWIVQVAPITSANVDGTPQPVWVDITSQCHQVAWNVGDAEAESRHPAASANVRMLDLHPDLGDPMALATGPDDRFGTQCLLRFGTYRVSTSEWFPQFTGLVDEVLEDWTPDRKRRAFTLTAYDPMYYLAGFRYPITYNTINAAGDVQITNLLAGAQFPLSWEIRTGVGGVPYTWSIQPLSNVEPLGVLHRIADSLESRAGCDGAGKLWVSLWSTRTDTGWVALDAITGTGLPNATDRILYTAARWRNSMRRMVYRAEAVAPPNMVSTFGTPVRGDRYLHRADRAGWPKRDLLNADTNRPNVTNATARSADPTGPDEISYDLATAVNSVQNNRDRMLRFLSVDWCSPQNGNAYTLQRRATGSTIFNKLCTVPARSDVVTRTRNRFRWQSTHALNWW